MNLEKVLLIFGKKTTLAKKVGVTNTMVSGWSAFNKIPDPHALRVRRALKKYKAQQDRAYKEVMTKR